MQGGRWGRALEKGRGLSQNWALMGEQGRGRRPRRRGMRSSATERQVEHRAGGRVSHEKGQGSKYSF